MIKAAKFLTLTCVLIFAFCSCTQQQEAKTCKIHNAFWPVVKDYINEVKKDEYAEQNGFIVIEQANDSTISIKQAITLTFLMENTPCMDTVINQKNVWIYCSCQPTKKDSSMYVNKYKNLLHDDRIKRIKLKDGSIFDNTLMIIFEPKNIKATLINDSIHTETFFQN